MEGTRNDNYVKVLLYIRKINEIMRKKGKCIYLFNEDLFDWEFDFEDSEETGGKKHREYQELILKEFIDKLRECVEEGKTIPNELLNPWCPKYIGKMSTYLDISYYWEADVEEWEDWGCLVCKFGLEYRICSKKDSLWDRVTRTRKGSKKKRKLISEFPGVKEAILKLISQKKVDNQFPKARHASKETQRYEGGGNYD